MIAAQPYFENIAELFVFENLFFGKMTMVIEYGHILCVFVIKSFGSLVFKQKIIFNITHKVTPVL